MNVLFSFISLLALLWVGSSSAQSRSELYHVSQQLQGIADGEVLAIQGKWLSFYKATGRIYWSQGINEFSRLDVYLLSNPSFRDSMVYEVKVISDLQRNKYIIDVFSTGWKANDSVFVNYYASAEIAGGFDNFKKRLSAYLSENYKGDSRITFSLFFGINLGVSNKLIYIYTTDEYLKEVIFSFFRIAQITYKPPIDKGLLMFTKCDFEFSPERDDLLLISTGGFDDLHSVNAHGNYISYIRDRGDKKRTDDIVFTFDRKESFSQLLARVDLTNYTVDNRDHVIELLNSFYYRNSFSGNYVIRSYAK